MLKKGSIMNNFFKCCWDIIYWMFKYKDIIILRWLRGLTEKPTEVLKLVKPKFFDEAVFCICQLATNEPKFLKMFDVNSGDEFATNCHHGIGQHIRNEWELWIDKSSLYKDIAARFNLFHADDMCGVILQTAWQRIKEKPETPALFSLGYSFYWEDMKKKEKWDGIANGEKVNFAISLAMRKEIEKEKKDMGY